MLDDANSDVQFIFRASSGIMRLITNHWTAYTPEQRLQCRMFIVLSRWRVSPFLTWQLFYESILSIGNVLLGEVWRRGLTFTPFLLASILQTISRITKLAWFDMSEQQYVSQRCRFFSACNYLNKLLLLNSM